MNSLKWKCFWPLNCTYAKLNCFQIIYIKMDLALNNLQRLICYKTKQTNQTKPNQSNQKNFCQNQMVNSQNNCWIDLSQQGIPILMKAKHSVYITVFGVATSDGDIMPLLIFPPSLRISTEVYIKCLVGWLVGCFTAYPPFSCHLTPN